ncbi:hypothetical protein EDB85DRAFT_1887786 [Lactarius pseudohatsudake]|nr:hypothetical protein EDB85DRAFT_1887786 [Lactarius pseudohatsudake]
MYALCSPLLLIPAVLTAQTCILYSIPRPSVLTLILQTPQFVPPSDSSLAESTNYGAAHRSTGSLSKQKIVSGKSFDRFIQIWLENADFESVNSTACSTVGISCHFYDLAKQGILLVRHHALILLNTITWRQPVVTSGVVGMKTSTTSHQSELLISFYENLPTDAFEGVNFFSTNYLNTLAPVYSFYVREHNPTIFYNSVASVPSRRALHRNFNDFAVDANASALSQWMFVTPNMVNDSHDTNIDFATQWMLVSLLNDTNFNDNRTLILLTFDENETYSINNRVFALLLGGAVPENVRGTVNSTYYTRYSSLYRGGKLGSRVTRPRRHEQRYVPFRAPNMSAVGAGAGPVFIAPGLDASITTPLTVVNLTARGKSVPWLGPRLSSSKTSNSLSSGHGKGATMLNALLADVLVLLLA